MPTQAQIAANIAAAATSLTAIQNYLNTDSVETNAYGLSASPTIVGTVKGNESVNLSSLGIQAGDLAVWRQLSWSATVTPPTSAIPSGFTSLSSKSGSAYGYGADFEIAYKTLAGSETTLTGMSSYSDECSVTVFRPNGGTWGTPSISISWSIAGGASAQTKSAGTAPYVGLAGVSVFLFNTANDFSSSITPNDLINGNVLHEADYLFTTASALTATPLNSGNDILCYVMECALTGGGSSITADEIAADLTAQANSLTTIASNLSTYSSEVAALGSTGSRGSPYGHLTSPPGTAVSVSAGASLSSIQTALNSVTSGGSLVMGAGTYNFGGGTLTGKSNVTIWGEGAIINNSAQVAMDFSNQSNFSVRGATPGDLVFNGGLVDCSGASATTGNVWSVGNCVFNNQPDNGFNGDAVASNGASSGLIVNNDFNNVGAASSGSNCTIGAYNWNNVTADGNHFTNCYQPVSMDIDVGSANGNNINFIYNILSGDVRAGFESGGGAQPFTNLTISYNWFVDVQHQGVAPVSIVATAQVNTTVEHNYFRAGPHASDSTGYSEAIEINSNTTPAPNVEYNTIDGYLNAISIYGTAGANFINNSAYGNTTTLPTGNTQLSSEPAVPAEPARCTW